MSHQQLENALRVEESRVGGDPCERYDELYKLLRAFEKSLKKTKGSYANWSDWDQRFMSRATYTNMKRHEACVASGRGGR